MGVVDASTANGEEPTVTDGPYLEAKEIIGGFYVVQAASRRRDRMGGRDVSSGRVADRGPPVPRPSRRVAVSQS